MLWAVRQYIVFYVRQEFLLDSTTYYCYCAQYAQAKLNVILILSNPVVNNRGEILLTIILCSAAVLTPSERDELLLLRKEIVNLREQLSEITKEKEDVKMELDECFEQLNKYEQNMDQALKG